MLRDEATGSPALHDVIEQFDIADEEVLLDVREFRMLGQNRFIWRLRLSDFVYYLYATDFVDSLEEITDTIRIASDGTPGELVAAKQPLDFETATPVMSTSIYEKPTDFDAKIAHYLGQSGYDFVALYRTEIMSSEEEDNEL